jgi:uridine kinase
LLASELAARVSAGELVLIDGRSGSGKTELAKRMASLLPDAQLVRLDDIYRGWGGLDAASALVPRILAEHRWQRWDWVLQEPAEWHSLDPARTLIIEGCGALSRASAPLAQLRIWVELDAATRKQRALARDGEAYAPHWDEWALQEDAFIARENPKALADEVVVA